MRRCAIALSVAALALAACGPKQGTEPAWPRSAGRIEVDPEKDGGESLEPTHASNVAAIERAKDPTPEVGEVEEAAVIEVVDVAPDDGDDENDAKAIEPTAQEPTAEPTAQEPADETEDDEE
ncbi:MAG: hypothetical protein K8M05_14195 [Deltaproteobacteria bacterium]|nr:hypothetical protein [Kofleriaceae bacterium]